MTASPEQHGHSLKYGLMIGMFAATLLIVAVGLGLISQISAPLAGAPPATEEPDGSGDGFGDGSGDSGNPGDGAGQPGPGPGAEPEPTLPPGVVTGALTTDLPLFAEPSVTSDPLASLLAGDTVTVVCTLLGEAVEYTDGTVSDAWLRIVAQEPEPEPDDDDATSPTPAPPTLPSGYVPALVVVGDLAAVQDC